VKTFVAYAVVAVGIPVWIGHLLGPILSIPISLLVAATRPGTKTPSEVAEASAKDTDAWLFGPLSNMAVGDIIAHASLDMLGGLAALFIAGLLFYFLGVHLGVVVLLILVAWEIIPIPKRLSLHTLLCRVAGMVAGWFLVRWLFSF